MKIINWLFGETEKHTYTPIPTNGYLEQHGRENEIGDFEIIENHSAPDFSRYKDSVCMDATVYRLNNLEKIPVVILCDLHIKELKQTLFGWDKNMTIGNMNVRICAQNNLSRSKTYYYYYDKVNEKKILFTSTMTIAEIDTRFTNNSGFLFINMGST